MGKGAKVGKTRVVAYCVMVFMFWFSNYTFFPYLSAYAATITANTALVGIMMGAYGWTQLALRIPIGIMADRYDNRRIFVRLGCCVTLVGTLGLFFAPNIYWMALFRALCGVAASVWVPMSVLFTSYFDSARSARMLTVLNSCNFGGVMFASVVAMPVVEAFGMRSAFLLAAICSLIPIVISFTLKEQPAARAPLRLFDLLRVGRTKWVLVLSIMSALCHIMVFAAVSGFTPQLALALGARQSSLGLIQLISTGGGTVFSLLSQRLFTRRFGARNTLIALLLVQALATIAQPFMPNLGLLYLVVAIDGSARGTCLSLFLGLVIMPFHYSRQSAAMGFYQAIYSFGIVLGPTLAGFVANAASISTAFYVIGGLGLVAPLLGLLFLPDERKALPPDPLGDPDLPPVQAA